MSGASDGLYYVYSSAIRPGWWRVAWWHHTHWCGRLFHLRAFAESYARLRAEECGGIVIAGPPEDVPA